MDWLSGLREGDVVALSDARGRDRLLRIASCEASGARVAHCDRTVYLVTGTRLVGPEGVEAAVGRLPAVEQAITLRPGDVVTLMRSAVPGRPAPSGPDGAPCGSAVIGCTLPEALTGVVPGHAIWFDDGKIGGVVVEADADALKIRITDASPQGDALRADKGINLPDGVMGVSGLTEQDRAVLPFAAAEVDMVGMSFVQTAGDVQTLAKELAALGRRSVGLVLKIETRQAFENLPSLLLAAMENPSSGVMIARGDLAVEMGYGRLAEVQEEILWMCEAAHLPVIWATQVLETLAKKGRPSRAEVTDAAMAVRAECVMLNKGPYIVEAVTFLDGVLRRMQEHQSKKSPMLRALAIAQRFGGGQERAKAGHVV
jgi:pyruvate kinase